ncbi:hypothetical protein ACLKA6_013742 [Drosophila palustris]
MPLFERGCFPSSNSKKVNGKEPPRRFNNMSSGSESRDPRCAGGNNWGNNNGPGSQQQQQANYSGQGRGRGAPYNNGYNEHNWQTSNNNFSYNNKNGSNNNNNNNNNNNQMSWNANNSNHFNKNENVNKSNANFGFRPAYNRERGSAGNPATIGNNNNKDQDKDRRVNKQKDKSVGADKPNEMERKDNVENEPPALNKRRQDAVEAHLVLVDKQELFGGSSLDYEDLVEHKREKERQEKQKASVVEPETTQEKRINKNLAVMFEKSNDNCSISTHNILAGKRRSRLNGLMLNETEMYRNAFQLSALKPTSAAALSTKSNATAASKRKSGRPAAGKCADAALLEKQPPAK